MTQSVGSDRRGEPSDLGQNRVALVVRRTRLGVIGRHENRRAGGRPDDRDVVGGAV